MKEWFDKGKGSCKFAIWIPPWYPQYMRDRHAMKTSIPDIEKDKVFKIIPYLHKRKEELSKLLLSMAPEEQLAYIKREAEEARKRMGRNKY